MHAVASLTFVSTAGHVFTTNYDLLLYWVLMRNPELVSKPINGETCIMLVQTYHDGRTQTCARPNCGSPTRIAS